jgi:hypothetical protein
MDTPCNNVRVDPSDPPTQKESTTNNPDENNENTQRDRNAANSRAEEKYGEEQVPFPAYCC